MNTRSSLSRLARGLCAAALCLLLTAGLSAAAYADYIHGYFRYTVEDQSVTITAYFGPETVVTVPAMIAGNPVNAVAADAFRDSGVQVVYLPDTIETVAADAFTADQRFFYISSPDGSVGPDPSLGLPVDAGGLVTTDDQGNLLLVNELGQETVLSDSGPYIRETVDGQVVIRDPDGARVSVSGSTVSFSRGGEDTTVTVNAGSMTVSSAALDADTEEAEEPDETFGAESAPVPASSPQAAQSAPLHPAGQRILLLLVLGAALIACAVLLLRRRGRRSKRS